jgi:hypothetical protein
MIEDAIWESEFCMGFDAAQVSRALARHGMLKHNKGRFTIPERFHNERNKRFHVITAKILTHDYDSTPEDVPDDDNSTPQDAPDDDGVPERPKRPKRPNY